MQTSNKKVFACGDVIGEKSTVAYASRSGRNTAENVIKYLNIIGIIIPSSFLVTF